MSRKRSEEAIARHHERFIAGAAEHGVPPEVAERVWGQIQGFSGFGFPKAHSAAFGLLAYQSAWLRVHYGPEFLCALLNEQPMGFYPPDALVHEAQRRGIEVRRPRRQPQPRALPRRARSRRADRADRARLRQGVREEEMEAWSPSASAAAPTRGSPTSPPARAPAATASNGSPGPAPSTIGGGHELRRRAGPVAGCGRRDAGGAADRRHGEASAGAAARAPPAPALRAARRRGSGDRRLPLDRDDPRRAPDGADAGGSRRRDLPQLRPGAARDGAVVEVAGMVVARQRPETAKGIVFMLLEDELGTVNLVVPPPVYCTPSPRSGRRPSRAWRQARAPGWGHERGRALDPSPRHAGPAGDEGAPHRAARGIVRLGAMDGTPARRRIRGPPARGGRARRPQLRAPRALTFLFKPFSGALRGPLRKSHAEHMFRPRALEVAPCSTRARPSASQSSTVSTS